MFAVAASVLMIGAVAPAFAGQGTETLWVKAKQGTMEDDPESMSLTGCGTVYSNLKVYEPENKVQLWFNAGACPSDIDKINGEVEVKTHDGTIKKKSWSTTSQYQGGWWYFTGIVAGDTVSGYVTYYI